MTNLRALRNSNLWLIVASAAMSIHATATCAEEAPAEDVVKNSKYVSKIPLPKDAAGPWLAIPISPAMFDKARWDLADLRLFDAKDQSVPYAVRTYPARSVRQEVAAREFNRVTGPDGSSELSLDLGETLLDHNGVEVATSGEDFRRTTIVEGSTDGENWGKLAEGKVLRFSGPRGVLLEQRIDYPTSRFRYLRVRVKPDVGVDKEPVEIDSVTIRRTVETPGEFVTRDAKLGAREPGSRNGVYGSYWTIDLGGTQVPCQRLEFTIEGLEFNRDFDVTPLPDKTDAAPPWGGYDPYAYNYYGGNSYRAPEATNLAPNSSLADSYSRFTGTHGTWRRRAGESNEPMIAELGNVRCGKLRIFVADAANEPLKIESVKFVAPLSLIIFANAPELQGPIRAYYGNSKATPPDFDFARNLPEKLAPAPTRIASNEHGPKGEFVDTMETEENPSYVPPPLPFTERWKWLIHCALGGVSLILAGLVVQLARRAIVRHDAQAAATTPG